MSGTTSIGGMGHAPRVIIGNRAQAEAPAPIVTEGFAPTVLIKPLGEPVVGHAPTVLIGPAPEKKAGPTVGETGPELFGAFRNSSVDGNPEAARYRKMWSMDTYREESPGEGFALTFIKQSNIEPDDGVIDFGCGTGRGALMLALFAKCKVTMIDFADNCLDKEVRQALTTQKDRLKFVVADLTKPMPQRAEYGYCTDVMEHVREDDVLATLHNILTCAQHVFFNIALFDDTHGPAYADGPLHLTVKPAAWWLEQLNKLGVIVHWSNQDMDRLTVYCSMWRDARKVLVGGKLNVKEEVADQQVIANVNGGWLNARPFDRQNREMILLAGGPSLSSHLEQIKEMRANKFGLVTVNGAYHWALDNGLEPGGQIVLDAREFNSRFTRPLTKYTKYFIASQCHPKTLEGLPVERTVLWHSGLNGETEKYVQEKTGCYFPIPGGSTVVLRAIPLLRMLGYWRLHIFGFDSCVLDGAHHSYVQVENDGEPLIEVNCHGKTFHCTPWMLSQASEFRDMMGLLGDEVELAVYGDGLIAHMIATGANFHKLEKE